MCPFLKTHDSGVDLGRASLPGRAPWSAWGSWAVIAGLGDRARDARLGGDGAAGQRRVRRRRGVGDAEVRDARGRKEQPVSPRGAPRRDRGAGRRRSAGSSTTAATAERRRGELTSIGRARPLMTQDGSRDRLACGQHRHRPAQDPRRRGAPRGSRCDRRASSFISSARTASGCCAAGRARSSPSATAPICRATVDGAVWITHLKRRDTPRAAVSSSCRPTRALDARRGRPRCARDRGARGRTHAGGSHLPRDRLRGARGRRLPALRFLQRRHEHRAMPAAARGVRLRPRAAAHAR